MRSARSNTSWMSWLIRKTPMPSDLQLLDELAHLLGLGGPERRGGLVHDEDLGVEVDGAGDGDGLPLPARQRPDRGLEVLEPRVQPLHDVAGGRRHGRVVEGAGERADLASEEHVARGVDVVGEGEPLVDRLDPVLLGVAGEVDGDRFAVDEDLARVRRVGAGERVDQRRLAGAVPSDEGDDLARVEVHADSVDGVEAAEGDADVPHLDERVPPAFDGAGGGAVVASVIVRPPASRLARLDHDGGDDQPHDEGGDRRPATSTPQRGVDGDRRHEDDADHDVLRR